MPGSGVRASLAQQREAKQEGLEWETGRPELHLGTWTLLQG